MADLKVLGCGICKEVFQPDPQGGELVSLNGCGHIFHSDCHQKFEKEGEIIIRQCFTCKADYGKQGILKMKPLFMDLQFEVLKSGGDDCGEHKTDIKALKTEVRNLRAQIKKDAKIAAEQQKSSELKAQIAKNKIRRLVTGVQDLNSSMMKFVDATDFETGDEAVVTVVERVEPSTTIQLVQAQVHTRSKDKDSGPSALNGSDTVGTSLITSVGNEDRDRRKPQISKNEAPPKSSKSGRRK